MKTIWIMNHYATSSFFDRGGRHYCFAKYLMKKGYQVTVFCASTLHNRDKNLEIKNGKYEEDQVDGISYVFVKTPDYKGNGISRIKNMLYFYKELFPVTRIIGKEYGRPDVILASSVHPLTLLAGIQIGRKYKVPCVCEIRDLWPACIVEFGNIPEKSLIIQMLYQLEKWIYRNADAVIFTMAGGKRYIKEKGWTKGINPKKIHYVNNGVDLEEFEYNKRHFQIQDVDLEDKEVFKVVYAGAIRKVNNLGAIVECARELQKEGAHIRFLIWGGGDEREELQKKCRRLGLENIVFKGEVEKKYIPYIVSKADANLVHGSYNNIMRFGCSPNKLFDYFAAGKPIFSDLNTEYDCIEKYQCGVKADGSSIKKMTAAFLNLEKITNEERKKMGENARRLSKKYDHRRLVDKVESILLEAQK